MSLSRIKRTVTKIIEHRLSNECPKCHRILIADILKPERPPDYGWYDEISYRTYVRELDEEEEEP